MGSVALLIGVLLVLVSMYRSQSADNIVSLEDVIFAHDQARLEKVVADAEPYQSLKEAHLVLKVINGVGLTAANKKHADSACMFVLAPIAKNLEDVFHITSVISQFSAFCKYHAGKDVEKKISDSLKGTPDTKTIYQAVSASAAIQMPIDNDTVPAALMEAVEKEDTPQSYAYAFLAASKIPGADFTALFENIEDIVAQADETPTTLYFEGGLQVTSDVVNGIFALADRVESKPALTEAQATKFANFLVSSKYTSSMENAAYMLSAARVLSTNKYVIPAAITLDNPQPVSSLNPDLTVRLTNLIGGAVEGFTVKVKSLEDPDGELNPRTRNMDAGSDEITFSYPMFKDTTGPGQYKVTVSSESKTPSPVVKLPGVELPVMVSFQVGVGSAQLSIVDKDQGVTTKSVSLEYPNTSKVSFQADRHSKVVMVFTLTNKQTATPITLHQAFIRLSLDVQEIFFVATPNADKQYSFELDVAESAKDFGQLSGTYSMNLVVGDFALENPFLWNFASAELKFPGTSVPTEENLTYKPKPLIEHLFRVPEKRPPLAVSTAFTVLVLVPLVLLHIVWLVMGANFSNFAAGGIWGVLFHTGLGAILCLYYCFWTQLNMFATLKYLVGLGVFTFFVGNRMLRSIAKARQS